MLLLKISKDQFKLVFGMFSTCSIVITRVIIRIFSNFKNSPYNYSVITPVPYEYYYAFLNIKYDLTWYATKVHTDNFPVYRVY